MNNINKNMKSKKLLNKDILIRMNINQLEQIANAMVKEGKGILAADESNPTCTKRFESIGVESNALSRNMYRDMLLNAIELLVVVLNV